MSVEVRFRFFGEFEARGTSPVYEELAPRVAEDEDILALLRPLSEAKQQPNLFFASVNYLGGVSENYEDFRSFVLDHADDVLALVRARRTQTNEVGRCATLLPAVGLVQGPIALIEVGASAGLNLRMDRYAYDYGPAGRLGESPVVVQCKLRGPCPIPAELPQVVWRKGIDIAPVDVGDAEQVRWLEACVFPGRVERLEALRAAVELARTDPPEVIAGDLVSEIEGVLDAVPPGVTAVVFHSAVLNYISAERRKEFAELVRRPGVVWISNEGGGIVDTLRWTDQPPPAEASFFLGRNGTELLAYSHPHGRWLEWLGPQAAELR